MAMDHENRPSRPGMNHKRLVTFDRKIKKDSFYLYKAWWTTEPMVHIAGKRYVDRPEKRTTVKVYSNMDTVTLYANGKKVATKKGKKIFTFHVMLSGETRLEAVAGDVHDRATLRFSPNPNPAYSLSRKKAGGGNWT